MQAGAASLNESVTGGAKVIFENERGYAHMQVTFIQDTVQQIHLTSLTVAASISTSQVLRVLLERSLLHGGISPQVGGQVGSGVTNSRKSGLDKVTEGLGLTTGLGVDIFNTGQFKELFDGGGGDEPGTTGSRDQGAEDKPLRIGRLKEKKETA